jgi:hypothetical protein
MLDDHGQPSATELHSCMYVPGFSRCLFSITKCASNGHCATITKDNVTLFFSPHACPVTILLQNGINIASNLRIVRRPLQYERASINSELTSHPKMGKQYKVHKLFIATRPLRS